MVIYRFEDAKVMTDVSESKSPNGDRISFLISAMGGPVWVSVFDDQPCFSIIKQMKEKGELKKESIVSIGAFEKPYKKKAISDELWKKYVSYLPNEVQPDWQKNPTEYTAYSYMIRDIRVTNSTIKTPTTYCYLDNCEVKTTANQGAGKNGNYLIFGFIPDDGFPRQAIAFDDPKREQHSPYRMLQIASVDAGSVLSMDCYSGAYKMKLLTDRQWEYLLSRLPKGKKSDKKNPTVVSIRSYKIRDFTCQKARKVVAKKVYTDQKPETLESF